jgi:hypothetical protein
MQEFLDVDDDVPCVGRAPYATARCRQEREMRTGDQPQARVNPRT